MQVQDQDVHLEDSGEGLFPRDFFYPHVAEREWARKLSGVPFIKAQICFMGAPSYDLITSPKPYLLIPSHWMLRFQHMNFGEDTNL